MREVRELEEKLAVAEERGAPSTTDEPTEAELAVICELMMQPLSREWMVAIELWAQIDAHSLVHWDYENWLVCARHMIRIVEESRDTECSEAALEKSTENFGGRGCVLGDSDCVYEAEGLAMADPVASFGDGRVVASTIPTPYPFDPRRARIHAVCILWIPSRVSVSYV